MALLTIAAFSTVTAQSRQTPPRTADPDDQIERPDPRPGRENRNDSRAPRPDQRSEERPAPPPEEPRVYRTTGSRIAIGRSIHIPADEEVSDTVVVVGGSLRVDGRVRDGIVVIGGNVQMGSQSDVRGDVVLVGGRLTRAEGARLVGSVSDVTFGEWATRNFGRVSVPVVDFGDFGRWVTLLGTIFRIALLAFVMAFMLMFARAPVARIGRAAASAPAKAFVLGLMAEILFLPILVIASIALIVTVVGIPLVVILVPLAFIAALGAMLLGFTGLACGLGEWVEDRVGLRAHSALLATGIGLILILAPTLLARMVGVAPEPVRYTSFALLLGGFAIEFVVWTIGLGATMMTGFGRWAVVPPPLPAPVQPSIAPVTP